MAYYFQAKQLCVGYQNQPLIQNIEIELKKGEILTLIGPNGAGKSTIIRHIVGAYRPDEGEILIDGENIRENASIKEKIAYIPDEIFYFSQATTLDMMHYSKGLYPSFDEQYFYKICKCFPMLNLKKPIRSFSKGTIKQVAFVLALSIHPALLVLDEPVDGLDPVMRRQIWSLIMGEVADRGTTVLVSSHNLRELEDVCDHIGILSHGHIILERSLDNLQSSVTKVQVAFDGDLPPIPEGLQVLHSVTNGRVSTLILKGQPREAQEKMAALHPLLLDVLPLSLEEIFIYEMEREHYEVKNILF